MKFSIIATIAFTVALAFPALAVEVHRQPAATDVASGTQLADGDVRKVDKDAKKITIKHGPIPSLDMPPMTMVFQVKDPALLDRVKAGDKIKFAAERLGGAYVIVDIVPAK